MQASGNALQLAAFKAIKDKGAPFISRGDRSGTHIAELNLWQAPGIDVEVDRHPWYKSMARGWARPSALRRHRTPTCCLIVAPGCRSRTAATSRSRSRATRGFSINMA